MAKDVAKLIYEIAINDRSLEGITLKEMFKRKIVHDAMDIRKKLEDIIATRIKTSFQPINCSIKLNSNMILGGSIDYVRVTQNPQGRLNPKIKNDKYTCIKDSGYVYHTITKDETKYLIDYAIVPLDLTWTTSYNKDGMYNIVVSWDHWSKK